VAELNFGRIRERGWLVVLRSISIQDGFSFIASYFYPLSLEHPQALSSLA
jgi:hypothetical protein